MEHASPILLLLVQIAMILALGRLMGLLAVALRQPQVVGEMLAGIMLGPSLLGTLAPEWHALLFPAHSIGYLGIFSQLGVIFFLFLVGLELDPKLLRNRGHAAVVISHVSIVAPFLLGAALAIYLYPRVFNDAPAMRFTSVALFMGAAMAITAFPVLARILTERNLHRTKVGAVAITCAAVDDVTAWCMLAFVIGIAKAQGWVPGVITAALSTLYVLTMFFVVRPFLRQLQRVHDRQGQLSPGVMGIIFLLVMVSAWVTETIGIHALFGAFLVGAMMPKGTAFVRTVSEKLEDFTIVFLLPIFFAHTGLKTHIGLINTAELWIDTLLIILVACLGKFGGSTLAGRACGLPWREASAVGILMNTRGLMELVILTIGLQEGIITPAVFAMMVLMALVTTALTTPVLHWIYPPGTLLPVPQTVEKPSVFSVLIPVALPRSGGPLLQIAAILAGPEKENRRIYALHLTRPVERDAYRSGIDPAPASIAGLDPLLNEARLQGVEVEPLSFVSRDVPSDIARVARRRDIDLVLMGFHQPVFGRTILGGTVHRVMAGVDCDVGIFVERTRRAPRRVLVPYLGSAHDRLALDLAGRMARHAQAEVTVLHIVPPDNGSEESARAPLHARTLVSRIFDDPAHPAPVQFKVLQDASPVDAVLSLAAAHDLIIVGVAEKWGLESHLFGFQSERIAADSPCSLLIVRRAEKSESAAQPSPADVLQSSGAPT